MIHFPGSHLLDIGAGGGGVTRLCMNILLLKTHSKDRAERNSNQRKEDK